MSGLVAGQIFLDQVSSRFHIPWTLRRTGGIGLSRCHALLGDLTHDKDSRQVPQTLVEAIRYFADADRSFEFVKGLCWADGVVTCPRRAHTEISFTSTCKIWRCKGCQRQFSLKVGSLLEDSGLGFDKWLPAIWLIANAKNGISSYELARSSGVT
jgi:hypothetical protein